MFNLHANCHRLIAKLEQLLDKVATPSAVDHLGCEQVRQALLAENDRLRKELNDTNELLVKMHELGHNAKMREERERNVAAETRMRYMQATGSDQPPNADPDAIDFDAAERNAPAFPGEPHTNGRHF